VTIVPNYEAGEAGSATHGGEWSEDEDVQTLRLFAEEAFWLRHAIALYAGAEAVRQLRPDCDPDDGAESDKRQAVDAIASITDDPASADLYFALARRRCEILVKHYAPEIEALAAALLDRQRLTGDETRQVFFESLRGRQGNLWTW
jgi:hypothetical protein